MQFIYKEKLILTKEEVEILNRALALVDNILVNSNPNGNIEYAARNAGDYISDLLSEELSKMEE